MKRHISIVVILALLLLSVTPIVNAQSTRIIQTQYSFSISGTTGLCELTVSGNSTTSSISATIKISDGDRCIRTWTPTGTGFLSFSDTVSLAKGNEYTMTVDVTIDGKAEPTYAITKSCT